MKLSLCLSLVIFTLIVFFSENIEGCKSKGGGMFSCFSCVKNQAEQDRKSDQHPVDPLYAGWGETRNLNDTSEGQVRGGSTFITVGNGSESKTYVTGKNEPNST